MIRHRLLLTGLAAVVVLATGAATTAAPAGATTAAKKSSTLTVLVTNDDGVSAPGIDALVQALRKVKNTKVVVVAPATNQSGTDEKTTGGALITSPTTTASGYSATAVQGYPADTVVAALDQLGVKPNVVLSGINAGQNLGTTTDLSGTVGAAKMAVQRGIPALALSQDVGTSPQYPAAATIAVAWLKDNRASLLKKPKTPSTTLDNVNVPNCPAGKPRGVVKVATASNADNALATVDCTSKVTKVTTDIEAFINGYAALAVMPAGSRPTG